MTKREIAGNRRTKGKPVPSSAMSPSSPGGTQEPQQFRLAYDVKLAAVARMTVTAGSLAEAKRIASLVLRGALDGASINTEVRNDVDGRAVRLTEASAYMDDADGPRLFEINGKEIG
jgi:hypothetical protein